MSKTLIVSFLPREGSNTAKLVESFKETASGKTEIIERKIDDGSVPLLSERVMKTWWGPPTENEAETASNEFIQELKAADNIVIATPMYNWSLPAPVKAWVDLVIRGGQTFAMGEAGPKGLLTNQNVGLLVTTGMTELESPADHLTPVLKTAFGFMGAGKVSVVGASELLMVDQAEVERRVTKAIEDTKALANEWFS